MNLASWTMFCFVLVMTQVLAIVSSSRLPPAVVVVGDGDIGWNASSTFLCLPCKKKLSSVYPHFEQLRMMGMHAI